MRKSPVGPNKTFSQRQDTLRARTARWASEEHTGTNGGGEVRLGSLNQGNNVGCDCTTTWHCTTEYRVTEAATAGLQLIKPEVNPVQLVWSADLQGGGEEVWLRSQLLTTAHCWSCVWFYQDLLEATKSRLSRKTEEEISLSEKLSLWLALELCYNWL